MQTDTYTKTILTIIAAGVLFIAFRDVPVIGNAQAQDATKPIDVNIVSVQGRTLNLQMGTSGTSVPVHISNK